jgi:hypothetical protein
MVPANLFALWPWIYVVYNFMLGLHIACLSTLLTAALLHWRRTKHWSLLAMGTGSLLMLLGGIASQIAQMRQRPQRLASGALWVDASVMAISLWIVAAGSLVATIGGIGAIRWAIQSKRRRNGYSSELRAKNERPLS